MSYPLRPMVSIFNILSWRTNSSALYYAQIWTNSNNICYILRMIPTRWTAILSDTFPDIISGIPSNIYSDILHGILPDVYSNILSGILCGILSGILRRWGAAVPIDIWRSLRSSSAHWDLELAVEVRQCVLSWRGWGPLEPLSPSQVL